VALNSKLEHLKQILVEMRSVVVAYSGGVDSAFLMKCAHDVLGDKAIGVLASSETYPTVEIEAAQELAREIGVRLINVRTNELKNEAFARNAPDRCYHCKMELFGKLKQIAADEGLTWIVHGANVDDLGDYRPGQKAANELGARAPLQEAGFTKTEIREASKDLGLPTWDKPSLACLSSRFPYGTRITPEALAQIDHSEKLLKDLGFRQVRVRHHGDIARIEVGASELDRLMKPEIRAKIATGLKELGYLYVTVDIEGYRTGSMNAALTDEIKV
jgi:pyridinium-3,5-biscarboxylic acid mononucleotide sulfurtransferase